jgi:hypothetical protein
MTDTLPADIKSSLEVTSRDVVKLLTNSHVTYGTKGDKIEKIKQALAGHDQLRSSILIKGKDANQVAAFDLSLPQLLHSLFLLSPRLLLLHTRTKGRSPLCIPSKTKSS